MANEKVIIQMRPHDILSIWCFCEEFLEVIKKNGAPAEKLASITEAIKQLESQIFSIISTNQIQEALLENRVNKITGRCPEN